jgi:hypothetical protein
MAGTVKKLESKDELDSILEAQKSNNNNNLELVVLHFGAAWCEASQDMDSVIIQLSVDTPRAQFFQVRIYVLTHNSILSLFTFIMLLSLSQLGLLPSLRAGHLPISQFFLCKIIYFRCLLVPHILRRRTSKSPCLDTGFLEVAET